MSALPKAITSYTGYGDSELDTLANEIYDGCNTNPQFTFTGGVIATLNTAMTDYHNKLPLAANGGKSAVAAKDAAKVVLQNALHAVAIQVNQQAAGNDAKISTTNMPLVTKPAPVTIGAVTNFNVKQTEITGVVKVSVDKPNYTDHGTLFAYAPPSVTGNDPNFWFIVHSNGHSREIHGLATGVSIRFAAAYKGKDEDALIWSSVITKTLGG